MSEITAPFNSTEATCIYCEAAIKEGARFCPACGKLQQLELKEEAIDTLKRTLIVLALFFFPTIFIPILLLLIGLTPGLKFFVYFDIAFSLFISVFVIYNYKEILPLVKLSVLNVWMLFRLGVLSIAFAVAVHFATDYLNISLFQEEQQLYHTIFAGTAFPLLFTILSIAIQPAIFEELGYRGFVMNQLMGVTNTEGAMFISAFMFGIIHLSVISLLWIIPLGIFYGYLRSRYSTLLYGIFCHFIHNSTIVFIGYYWG